MKKKTHDQQVLKGSGARTGRGVGGRLLQYLQVSFTLPSSLHDLLNSLQKHINVNLTRTFRGDTEIQIVQMRHAVSMQSAL